jgi:hypothetical protein
MCHQPIIEEMSWEKQTPAINKAQEQFRNPLNVNALSIYILENYVGKSSFREVLE